MKSSLSTQGGNTLNAYIQGEQEKVNGNIREAKLKDSLLSLDLIKEEYLRRKNDSPSRVLNVIQDFEEFIEISKSSKRIQTIKNYNVALSHLKDYQADRKLKLKYDSFTLPFYENYVNYLIDEKGLSNNSIGGYIKNLKVFLNNAFEKGLHSNLTFKKYKVFNEQSDMVYLTFEELLLLHETNLSYNNLLENVCDIFCLACFTGLRFSDVTNLKRENISSKQIRISAVKKKEVLSIPLNKYSIEILERLNYQLPKPISNQKMNKYLKELGEYVGIDKPVTVVQYSGGKRIDRMAPKYEFMTSHMARRTFVTLSLEKGMRAEVLMPMTGHKSWKTMKKYVKIVEKVKQNEMEFAWGN